MNHTALRCHRLLPRLTRGFAVAILLAAPWQVALSSPQPWQQQVFAAERAFAKSMADRDPSAFASHVSDEAIFFDGNRVLRGKKSVVAAWSRFFTSQAAPFSWEPDRVEVLRSGTLALSTGPVRAPDGKVVGRFNSIWRREGHGVWRVVFDKGSPADGGPQHQP